jgi:PilZ domain-containing protein
VAELNPVRDPRVRVAKPGRVRTSDGEHVVTVVAMSARSALVLAKEPLGTVGRVIDLMLPGSDGSELEITAGIERVERVHEGDAVAVQFMLPEPSLRRALKEMLAHLLAGDGGGTRRHPRVIYDVRVRIGSDAEKLGLLEEISLSGCSVRVGARLEPGEPLVLRVPVLSEGNGLRVIGRVVEQRKALDGGWRTGVAFDDLDERTRTALSKLLADLMCR